MAKAFKIRLTAWSPLGGGLLSGKYHSTGTSEKRYSDESMQQFLRKGERVDRIVSVLKKISDETGRSQAQVALAWLRNREVPVIPIIGARRIPQLQDNLASLTLELSQKQVAQLNDASAIELGFPHDLYEREMVRSFIHGGMRDQILAG